VTTFFALIRRDFLILRRNAILMFLADQSQSILFAIVFAFFFPKLNMVSRDFALIVLPGLVSMTVLMGGTNGVLVPLWRDLLGHREVDERLLAPISVTGVALEKIIAGAASATLSGLVSLPVMMLLIHRWHDIHPNWPILLPMVAIGGFVFAAFGLTVGAMAGARFSGFLFDAVIGPMIFFGCTYYAWEPLRAIGPVRYLFLINPLVFVSEGLRLAITPQIPHMPVSLILSGLLTFSILFSFAGTLNFKKRTIL
jgi:ABC-2 type transport system permease protein